MSNRKHNSKQKKRQLAANNDRRMAQSRANYALHFSAPSNIGDTLRDDAAQYGYPCQLSFMNYYNAYSRGGFFNALVDIVPERCFNQMPIIVDGDENDSTKKDDTVFEVELKKLNKKFNLLRLFKEAEKMKDVGSYSAIVPVFKESGSEPKLSDEPSQAQGGVDSVVAMNVYYEPECEASTDVVMDYFDKDYNKPVYYKINNSVLSDRQTTNAEQIEINRKRVFILTNATGSTVYGKPALESPFNALFDQQKIRGASAEGYRKNSMQKYILNANDNAVAGKAFNDPNMAAKLDKNIDDFNDNFNQALKVAGMDVNMLQGTIEDPTGASTVALQEACASRRVPVTELIGFMTGERSSSENSSAFSKRLKGEQENEYGPRICAFLYWLVDLGILPAPSKEITVIWPDIAEPTLSEKLEMADKMTMQNERAFKSRQEPPWATEEIREVAGFETDKPDSEYDQEDDKSDETLDNANISDQGTI